MWYVYHSDLSHYVGEYVSDCTVSVSLRRVICLSLYHSDWSLYVSDCTVIFCISITKKSDMSVTVIYHTMSNCTVSVSLLRRVISLSQWFITLCLWLYCISITKKSDKSITMIYHTEYVSDCTHYYISITKESDMSITMIYHTMSMSLTVLTTISVSLRRVICLSVSQWFITLHMYV